MPKDVVNGTTISVEWMGVQKRPYNSAADDFEKAVVPHGSIVARVPNDLLSSVNEVNDVLDSLCEASIHEGYVVITPNGDRGKLKRENFRSKEPDSEEKRGPHKQSPSFEKGEYTPEGLDLCGGDSKGYYNAPLSALVQGITEEVTIAKLNIITKNGKNDNNEKNHIVDLVSVPIQDVITDQIKRPFTGEKMMNFFKTEGQGKTYRYTNEPLIDGALSEPQINSLTFQMKFDGETALVRKDKNGVVHFMLKFQIDVWEIERDDGSFDYRFGWI